MLKRSFTVVVLLLVLLTLMVGNALAQGNGLDLNQYCASKGWGVAVLRVNNVYGWKCFDGLTYRDMNLNEACVMAYGPGYQAYHQGGVYTWYCATSNPNNPPPTPTPTSVPPSVSPPTSGGQVPASSNSGNPGMDIAGWCRSMGHSGARATGDAYSWICTNADGSRARDIDVDAVCRFTNGNAYPYAGFTDQNNPYSWYCASTPQGRPGSAPAQPPVQSGGNNGGSAPVPNNPPVVVSPNQCPPTQPVLSAGSQGRVKSGSSVRVRRQANTSAGILATAGPMTVFNVVSGPYCSNSYRWWEISYGNVRGYIAEGTSSVSWVEAYSNVVVPPSSNGCRYEDGIYCENNYNLPNTPPGTNHWISLDYYNRIHQDVVDRRNAVINQMTVLEWAKNAGRDVVLEFLLEDLNFPYSFAYSFLTMSTNADLVKQYNLWNNRLISLERYHNNNTYRYGDWTALPATLVELPAVSNSLFMWLFPVDIIPWHLTVLP